MAQDEFHDIFPFLGTHYRAKQRLRRILTKFMPLAFWYELKKEWRFFLLRFSKKSVKKKLKGKQNLRVNIGCSRNLLNDWVNVDVFSKEKSVLLFDCRKELPFEDNSVDFMYCEHMLEHLDYSEEVPYFLKECLRSLRPGGVLRLSVPDGIKYIEAFLEPGWQGVERVHGLKERYDHFLRCTYVTKMELMNTLFRQGGEHKFIYDYETLEYVLSFYGFKEIIRKKHNETSIPNFPGDSEFRREASLYVEAMKDPA